MVLYHRDFSKEEAEDKDVLGMLNLDEAVIQNAPPDVKVDRETAQLNRAKMKALFLAEEMKAEITVEREKNELRIIICKKC